MLTLGAAVGALIGGVLSDQFGRKPLIFLADVLFMVGALVLAFAQSVAVLVLGRFVIGTGVGMALNVVAVYLSETAPSPLRGRVITIYQFLIAIGGFTPYVICWFVDESWRWLFGLGFVPALVQLVGMCFLPESPRWLLKYEREAAATQSFNRIYNTQSSEGAQELAMEIGELKRALREEGRLSFGQQLKLLFSEYYRAVFVGDMLFVIQQFAGINSLFYYGPTIILSAGFGSELSGFERERHVMLLI